MDALGNSSAYGSVSGGCAYSVADLHPQTDDVVGDDVLVSGESVRTCSDGAAVSYHALEWLYRELKRAKIARAHAGRRIGVRQDELEALDRKILVLDYLVEKEIKEL